MQKILLVLLRIWLSFVAVAVTSGVVFLFIDSSDLLRSDDPYAVGFACGTVAMGFAVVYSLLERLIARKSYLVAAYLAALFGWCASLYGTSFQGGEGEEILKVASFVSLIAGGVTLTICVKPPSRLWISVLTIIGLIAMMLYVIVAIRMSLRH